MVYLFPFSENYCSMTCKKSFFSLQITDKNLVAFMIQNTVEFMSNKLVLNMKIIIFNAKAMEYILFVVIKKYLE